MLSSRLSCSPIDRQQRRGSGAPARIHIGATAGSGFEYLRPTCDADALVDLAERQLITWTASELARIQVLSGDVAGARQTLEDPAMRVALDRPGARTSLLVGEAVIALAEEDRDVARARSIEAIDSVAPRGVLQNPHAAQIWWAARLFGPDAVGGEAAAEEARALLEAHAWKQALLEPDLAPGEAPVHA